MQSFWLLKDLCHGRSFSPSSSQYNWHSPTPELYPIASQLLCAAMSIHSQQSNFFHLFNSIKERPRVLIPNNEIPTAPCCRTQTWLVSSPFIKVYFYRHARIVNPWRDNHLNLPLPANHRISSINNNSNANVLLGNDPKWPLIHLRIGEIWNG